MVSRWFLGGLLVVTWWCVFLGSVSVVSRWFLIGGVSVVIRPCLGVFLVVSLCSMGGDSFVSRCFLWWFLGGFFVVSRW